MVLAIKECDAERALDLLNELNIVSKVIGKVEPKEIEDNSIEIKLT